MEYSSIISSVITALATLLAVWLSRRLNSKKSDPVIEDTFKSSNVYTALNYTMEELKSDRAYVLEFHNGSHYYSGRGQKKFSCTHETVEEGISPQCNISQEHRVSNYHGYVSELIEKESFIYQDVNLIEDKNFLNLLKLSGTSSIINIPIKTLNGKIIGILGVDYIREQKITEKFKKDSIDFLKIQARIIAGYLS